MSQQQKKTTDSLISVIQTIQTGQWTGELRAQRADGLNTEIGSIVFVNGQIVAAKVGSHQGLLAFNILKTWRRSVFTFTPNTPPPLSQSNSSALKPPDRYETPPPVTGPQRSITGPQRPITGPQSSITGITGSQRAIPAQQQGAGLSLTAVPRATMSIIKARGIIEKAGFSRSYRQLILLIDGQRSVGDLIIAMGCTSLEMQQMLQQLEALSVIRVPR